MIILLLEKNIIAGGLRKEKYLGLPIAYQLSLKAWSYT
jgi:hypothetical protein